MNRMKRRNLNIIMLGILGILLASAVIAYLLSYSRYTSEIDQLTKQIDGLEQSLAEQKKENEDLQATILEAKKTITALEEQTAESELNQEDQSDNETTEANKESNNETTEPNKEQASADSSPGKKDETSVPADDETNLDAQSTEQLTSEPTEAIKLVKEYIGYANESNVHFDIEGNVPGSSDICIHVYEVVDDGESQHTATQGWYGVNLNSKSVYDTEGL